MEFVQQIKLAFYVYFPSVSGPACYTANVTMKCLFPFSCLFTTGVIVSSVSHLLRLILGVLSLSCAAPA